MPSMQEIDGRTVAVYSDEERNLGITKARLAGSVSRVRSGGDPYVDDAAYVSFVCASAGLSELPSYAAESYYETHSGRTVQELEGELSEALQAVPPEDFPVVGAEPVVQVDPVAVFTAALERYYDRVAQAKRYDNRYTCTLRAGYPGPFQAEGLAFAAWMDLCNAYAYGVMAAVQAGQRAMPESTDALIAELPPLPWPVE